MPSTHENMDTKLAVLGLNKDAAFQLKREQSAQGYALRNCWPLVRTKSKEAQENSGFALQFFVLLARNAEEALTYIAQEPPGAYVLAFANESLCVCFKFIETVHTVKVETVSSTRSILSSMHWSEDGRFGTHHQMFVSLDTWRYLNVCYRRSLPRMQAIVLALYADAQREHAKEDCQKESPVYSECGITFGELKYKAFFSSTLFGFYLITSTRAKSDGSDLGKRLYRVRSVEFSLDKAALSVRDGVCDSSLSLTSSKLGSKRWISFDHASFESLRDSFLYPSTAASKFAYIDARCGMRGIHDVKQAHNDNALDKLYAEISCLHPYLPLPVYLVETLTHAKFHPHELHTQWKAEQTVAFLIELLAVAALYKDSSKKKEVKATHPLSKAVFSLLHHLQDLILILAASCNSPIVYMQLLHRFLHHTALRKRFPSELVRLIRNLSNQSKYFRDQFMSIRGLTALWNSKVCGHNRSIIYLHPEIKGITNSVVKSLSFRAKWSNLWLRNSPNTRHRKDLYQRNVYPADSQDNKSMLLMMNTSDMHGQLLYEWEKCNNCDVQSEWNEDHDIFSLLFELAVPQQEESEVSKMYAKQCLHLRDLYNHLFLSFHEELPGITRRSDTLIKCFIALASLENMDKMKENARYRCFFELCCDMLRNIDTREQLKLAHVCNSQRSIIKCLPSTLLHEYLCITLESTLVTIRKLYALSTSCGNMLGLLSCILKKADDRVTLKVFFQFFEKDKAFEVALIQLIDDVLFTKVDVAEYETRAVIKFLRAFYVRARLLLKRNNAVYQYLFERVIVKIHFNQGLRSDFEKHSFFGILNDAYLTSECTDEIPLFQHAKWHMRYLRSFKVTVGGTHRWVCLLAIIQRWQRTLAYQMILDTATALMELLHDRTDSFDVEGKSAMIRPIAAHLPFLKLSTNVNVAHDAFTEWTAFLVISILCCLLVSAPLAPFPYWNIYFLQNVHDPLQNLSEFVTPHGQTAYVILNSVLENPQLRWMQKEKVQALETIIRLLVPHQLYPEPAFSTDRRYSSRCSPRGSVDCSELEIRQFEDALQEVQCESALDRGAITNPEGFFSNGFLGRGAFASVYRSGLRAVKRIPYLHSSRECSILYDIYYEVQALKRIRQLKLFEFGRNIENEIEICTEICAFTLSEWCIELERECKDVKERSCAILKVFCTLCGHLQTIHDTNLAHLDIKCDNILIRCGRNKEFTERVLFCKNGEEMSTIGPYIVYADFGEAMPLIRAVSGALYCPITRSKGTEAVKSPEMLRLAAHDISDTTITAASDIWSMGCLLYEMMAGELLFHRDHVVKSTSIDILYEKLGQSTLLHDEEREFVAKIIDICEHILKKDGLRRPTLSQIQELIHTLVSYIKTD